MIFGIVVLIGAYLLAGAATHCMRFKDGGLYSKPSYFFTWCVFWLPIMLHASWAARHVSDEEAIKKFKEFKKELEERGTSIEDELKDY